MTTKNGKSVCLQSVTMIDLATGWVEIHSVPSAQADLVFNKVELLWVTRYPLPSKVIRDQQNKFLAELKAMNKAKCGIKIKLHQETYKLNLY